MTRIITTLQLSERDVYAWTDSSIVLSWLSDHPRRWKTYVGNRTSYILEHLPRNTWRHISSRDNPANSASRGIMPSELIQHDLWWHGPSWLTNENSSWPQQNIDQNITTELEQRKQRDTLNLNCNITIINDTLYKLFETTSRIQKITRIISYCTRFYKNCKAKKEHRILGPLRAAEINNALIICIKYSQQEFFLKEINTLSAGHTISSKSSLSTLSPFLDTDGCLRVGGRLKNASIKYDAKYPIILPKLHILSKMIIHSYHKLYLHPGPSLLSSILRQKYWIIHGRSIIRQEVRRCIICVRQRSQTSKQIMGDLPASRITPSRPFSHVGVDYAGPVHILDKRRRGSKLHKGYIAVFVCFCTKAVHIEAVSDLSTDAFLACLRRFTSRRGLPQRIYSDNGSNFLGANRRLSEITRHTTSKIFQDKIQEELSIQNIDWNFIPPGAPHFGGLWESAVKQVKGHLVRAVSATNLTFEELQTLLCQIETVLNSRPLWSASEDPNELVLSPGHFLSMAPLTALPDENLYDANENRLTHWQKIQKQLQIFWNRYSKEYLNQLQQLQKWKKPAENMKTGDIVLIKEENLPACKRALGKIQEIHPGSDGIVRVVTIKTAASNSIKRPVTKVCKLPVHNPASATVEVPLNQQLNDD